MNGSSTTGALLDPPATLCFTFVTRQKILTILTFLPSQLGDRRIREAASLSFPPVGGKDRRLNKIAGAILGDIFAGHGPPNQRPQVTGGQERSSWRSVARQIHTPIDTKSHQQVLCRNKHPTRVWSRAFDWPMAGVSRRWDSDCNLDKVQLTLPQQTNNLPVPHYRGRPFREVA